jgi:3-deoxy-D-arabino-heptulosonate 7-phosphate (DAHP) synthase class II
VKKLAKKMWYTVAYLTREGAPHSAHRSSNFTRVYKSREVLLADLVYAMTRELGRRGAYVAAAWPGNLTEAEALRGPTRPLYYVYEDGGVKEL